VVVYFHGGGWVVGSIDTYDVLCRALANRAGAVVVSVDVHAAPEHRYPAQVQEAMAAIAWARANAALFSGDAARIGVAGDSAGGTIAAACARRLRDEGTAAAFQVLIYPILDALADTSSGSYARFGKGCYLETDDLQWYWGHYLPEGADRADGDISPLRARDLVGLPRTLLVVAGLDPLQDDNRSYADRLAQAGVDTQVAEFEDMPHGFVRFAARFDDAVGALEAIGTFVQRHDR
jgi:acetyl esterase